jgi:hypothetical protein
MILVLQGQHIVQMPHVIHGVFGGSMDAMGGQLNLDAHI